MQNFEKRFFLGNISIFGSQIEFLAIFNQLVSDSFLMLWLEMKKGRCKKDKSKTFSCFSCGKFAAEHEARGQKTSKVL